ncbi:MAG: hypothetical protein ACYTKD_20540, partial [Planctomycetota bacterium]
SSHWQDDTPISQRALSAEYALTVEAETLLCRPPWISRDGAAEGLAFAGPFAENPLVADGGRGRSP